MFNPNPITLVLGASTNPARYAYKAVQLLREYGYQVEARGRQTGAIFGLPIKPLQDLTAAPIPQEPSAAAAVAHNAAQAAAQALAADPVTAQAASAAQAPAPVDAPVAQVATPDAPAAEVPVAKGASIETPAAPAPPVAEALAAPVSTLPKRMPYGPGQIDTVTLYLRPEHQWAFAETLLAMKPRRVIFNPDTENPALAAHLRAAGIVIVEACTLVLLRTGQYDLAGQPGSMGYTHG